MKKIFLLGIFLFCGGLSVAYEFAPSAPRQVRPLTQEERQTDDNGDPVALLTVQSEIKGLIFDGAALPAEKTGQEYRVYVAQGTDRLFLRAPGVKALTWQVGELNPAFVYRATIGQKGHASQSKTQPKALLAENFRYELFDQEWVVLNKQNPNKYALLKINTDLPFSVLQQGFLRAGQYVGPVESAWYKENYKDWDGRVTPPYILLVKPGTKLAEVLEWPKIEGVVKGETTLDENKGVYWIELSGAGEEKAAPEVTQQVKSQLQRNLKP